MPRVALQSLKGDLGKSLDATVSTTGTLSAAEHVGLLVYNSKEQVCKSIAKGLYVWNGIEWQFLGKEEVSPDVFSFTDSRDGEVYLASKFGSAGIWMVENLRYNPLRNPDLLFPGYVHTAVNAASVTDKHFAYNEGYENPYNPANHPTANWELYRKNGLIYNWGAANNNNNIFSGVNQGETPTGTDPLTTPIRGICPKDWHLPSDKEWNDLEKEIYENAEKYSTVPVGFGTWNTAWNHG